MSDEAPDITPDTPNPEADTPGPTDWQKRYSDLQPEYTRATQALKDHEKVWEDDQALLARIAETHPHLLTEPEENEPADDPEWDDDDPIAPVRTDLDEFKTWRAEVDAERGSRRFTEDLSRFAGDREVSQQGREWIEYQTTRTGNNPQALEKATKKWFEFEDSLRAEAKAEYLKTKRGPTPPPAGRQGEEQRNPRDRNARRATMAAAIEAAQHDQQ